MAMSEQDRDLLAFQLKLKGERIRKRAFLSTGRPEDKARILPSAKQLAALGVEFYATEGTSAFLDANGVRNTRLHRISERVGQDVAELFHSGRIDFVVNVLTGDHDYDERSDARRIRSLAIEHGAPLVTEVDVAVATIERMIRSIEQERERQTRKSMAEYFAELVFARGGYVNNHAHPDKAFLMSAEYLELGMIDMQKKWELFQSLKENYTFDDVYARICRMFQTQYDFGVRYLRGMVDADPVVKLLCIDAALAAKEAFRGKMVIEIGVQPLAGVLNPDVRPWFIKACERADFIGGLPSKDRPQPEKHIDFILDLGNDLGKMVDVHVDQEDNPNEDETRLLALKTIEHKMEGRVAGIHCISLACKPRHERQEVCRIAKDAALAIVVCTFAGLGMKKLDVLVPAHNSIAPIEDCLNAKLNIGNGSDNVEDFFEPFVDGDPWAEAKVLMDACRNYTAPTIADIMCNRSLFNATSLAAAA